MSRPAVTVYTTGPQCRKCTLTKKFLDKHGITYTEVRIDENPQLADQLRADGFTVAPIVETAWRWSDFRHDKLRALAEMMNT